MSLQTGVETPSGPASRRIGDRVRYRMDLWTTQPNPLWVREMRQSARLVRTPIILMVLTVLVVMLMASIGGLMAGNQSPAEVGTILFHVYFSLAWFVVTLVGPALAANSIASEREGRTWEAVLLTGMRPEEVARGKFLSAYTAIAMYIVMLAPVGALPFLFGGVTPIEVLVAFVFLFLIALLSVAFGLAISAKMQSLRGALLVTLLVATPLSAFCFTTFGVGGSALVHDLWNAVEAGPPVWLPTAYGRAPFGVQYVVYLIAIPTAAVCLPAWLLYEVTRANLTSVTDDRSYGLKRWLLVASLVVTATCAVPLFAAAARDRADALMVGMGFYATFIIFNAFLFGGEAIGPSRRVKVMLANKSALRRFLAPSVTRAAQLLLLTGLGGIALLFGVGVAFIGAQGGPYASLQTEQLTIFSAYAVGFSTFVIGLAAFLRARSVSTAVPRVLLLVVLFFIFTGPWIVAAIAGVLAGASGKFDLSLAMAAPSPFYIAVAVEALSRPDPGVAVIAAMAASGMYGLLGFLLLIGAHVRTRKIITEHEAILAEADARLLEEDALAEAARRSGASTRAVEQSPPEPEPAPAPAAAPAPAPDGSAETTSEPPARGALDPEPHAAPAPSALAADAGHAEEAGAAIAPQPILTVGDDTPAPTDGGTVEIGETRDAQDPKTSD